MKTLPLLFVAILSFASITHAAPFGWGHYYIGNGGIFNQPAPVAVDTSGVLSGKTLVAMDAGDGFTVALSSDHQIYTWGDGSRGQLGNGSTTDSLTPVAVDMTGVLATKTITAIAAGEHHCLALSSDGKVYSWGYNNYGTLGDGTNTSSSVPVAVDTTGVLSGKTVNAIAAGYLQSMALTSDGKVFTWGVNTFGVLGDGTTTFRYSPVAVDDSGVLSGKTIVAIAMGNYHGVAVSSTGRVYTWGGYGSSGTLGDGLATDSLVPVAVDRSGVLSGKSIVAVAAGQYHTLALSSDGLVYSWGFSLYGELGDGANLQRNSPVAVDTSGLLSGQTVTAIAAGLRHSVVLTDDGTVASFGSNNSDEIGDGSGSPATVPTALDTSGVLAGMSVTFIAAGDSNSFCLAAPVSSTITPAKRFNYAANFSWLNWRWSGSASDAPTISNDFLAGRVYAANIGWIDLGNGSPAGAASHYSQTSNDIGVNNDGAGNLTGYAYGANIGWIYFDPTIAAAYRPRVNIVTGLFSGYAYSANCGWIELAGIKSAIKPGADAPLIQGGSGNGIADSWEKERSAAAGMGESLGLLANTPGADYDHDGISDADEYLADTNPFDPKDQLHVTNFSYDPTTHQAVLDWNGSTRRAFTVLYSYDLVNWSADATTAPGNGANVLITGQPSPQLFFKVQAQLPLAPTGDPGI